LKIWKLVCGLIGLAILASNLVTMSRWSERRGVSDDVCYLRQAHLFQQHGLGGLDTDIARETDGYFARLVTETGHPEWNVPGYVVCHPAAANGKRVLQYPPGVGFLLALFPEGRQVVPLYTAASVVVLLMGWLGIALVRTRPALLGAAAFSWLALYFMINPAKASYSIAPTMALAAIVGYLTAKLFYLREARAQMVVTALIGLLIGLSVNFRIPNLLLAAGFGIYFLIAFAMARNVRSLLQGALFGAAFVVGVLPTLIANTINAGRPFTTTYGAQDVTPPDFSFSVIGDYLKDVQGILGVAAIVWVVALLVKHRRPALWPVGVITAINLAVNLAFFLSHPIFTQYYLVPIVMLSLWCLLFAYVMDDRETAAFHLDEIRAQPVH
jgi:hypothetical protein